MDRNKRYSPEVRKRTAECSSIRGQLFDNCGKHGDESVAGIECRRENSRIVDIFVHHLVAQTTHKFDRASAHR